MDYNTKYLNYKSKYLKLKSIMEKNNIMSGGALSSNNKICLFKAEWCPHCVNFKSTWKELERENKDKIKFVTYDSEKNSEEIKKFNIKGYPTIIITVKNKSIEYIGPRDKLSINEFINKYS